MSKATVVILSIVHEGLTVSQAARAHGFSRTHIYRLLTRYQEGGLQALEARKPVAKSFPHRTPHDLRERIIELRTWLTSQGLDSGPVSLQWYLEQEGRTPPSTSTIRRILLDAGLVVPQPKKRPKSSLIRFEAAQPNETWQADVCNWTLADGTKIDILDWLDDHSRLLLDISCHRSVNGDTVVTRFTKLIRTHGTPYSTLTDNGMVFTARFTGGINVLEHLLASHGIRQKNGSPGHPQTQGKIERFHQTLKNYLRKQPPAHTLRELQQQLRTFQTIYNHQRPHRSLGRNTPAQAYATGIKASPNLPPVDNAWRIRHDHVDKDGKVSFRRAGKMHHLGVGKTHQKTPVIIHADQTHATVANERTGEVISQHLIEPDKAYWRNQLQPPGRWPKKKSVT